jgi:hypothetical protein
MSPEVAPGLTVSGQVKAFGLAEDRGPAREDHPVLVAERPLQQAAATALTPAWETDHPGAGTTASRWR